MKSKFLYLLSLIACFHFSYSLSSSSASDPHPTIEIPIFAGGYNIEKIFDAAKSTKSVTYKIQTKNPPTEVLEFYDAYFNGSGWRSSFEICQRNWEDPGGGEKTVEPLVRQLYASWAHPEEDLKAVLWLTYKVASKTSQNEVVVQCRLHPKTAK